MKLPKMILFDYGQTLIAEEAFDGVKGTATLLEYATENRYHLTAGQIQDEAEKVLADLGWTDNATRNTHIAEVHEHIFNRYFYESLGISFSLSPVETERIFWDAAAPGVVTEGIADFLAFLRTDGIRSGVISNISFSEIVLKERIARLLPDNDFEFIIASSEYVFRKPHRRIFDLALTKADLTAGEVWYIGDNYDCDIIGAQNAGIFPVRYKGALRSGADKQDDSDILSVFSWSELKELIMNL